MQDIKLSVHDRYSRIPIDMHGEVVRALQLQGDESIVDIGCGTGLFLKYLRGQRGHTGPLVGVDFSAGIMEGIRAICQAEGLNIGFSVCDAETLCFSDSTVDAVSLQHMLSYVPDMDRACKEAGRICKRGGSCVFTANAMRNYPHIRKYRELAAKLLGWPMIEVNTSRFCVEVMDKVLSPHFSQVNITVHEGLLHLPADEFVRWFTSMLDNWVLSLILLDGLYLARQTRV